MNWRKNWWLPGFTVAFLTVGVPYWLTPYNQLNLPDAVVGAGLLGVIAAAALARAYSRRPFWRVVVFMGCTVPAVVMVRVLVDGLRDSTSHNLWPFEVVIAACVGAITALAGTLLGSVVLLLSRRELPGR